MPGISLSTAADPGAGVWHLGADLAWGSRNRTGLAVLDPAGRLVASGSVRSDEEIAEWVAEHAPGEVVAAVDAPLVVPNEAGRRPCEAQVAAQFARFGAGPYPSNRGIPVFRPEPRAARLAARLGWAIDPSVTPGTGRSVCLEVYPHPAMVSLFGLTRIIPYKVKPGRDLVALQHAYSLLMGHLETHCGELLGLGQSARWAALWEHVRGSRRPADLRGIEDEVDAVVCAYLAWLWHREPSRLRVYGDVASGYIVTPHPPAVVVRPP